MNVEPLSQAHLRGLTPDQDKQVFGATYPILQNYVAYAANNATTPLSQFPYLNDLRMPAYHIMQRVQTIERRGAHG